MLYDASHLVSSCWLNTSVEASITKVLHPSHGLFVMRPECIVGLTRTKLVLEILGHCCGLASGIIYNSNPSMDERAIVVMRALHSMGQFSDWTILTLPLDIFFEFI